MDRTGPYVITHSNVVSSFKCINYFCTLREAVNLKKQVESESVSLFGTYFCSIVFYEQYTVNNKNYIHL
jgi:hypothetical protein